MRTAEITRKTKETDIALRLCLDGRGESAIESGVGFLDHMLTAFASHGKFDLTLRCKGDTYIDDHHSVEDIGIALGQAFTEALGDKKGIHRFGDCILPMDDALVLSAVDFSGRSHLGFLVDMPSEKVGSFDTELVQEFWYGFVRKAECALHVRRLAGENSHHLIEGIFKSVGRSLRDAVRIDPEFADQIPSTKGVL